VTESRVVVAIVMNRVDPMCADDVRFASRFVSPPVSLLAGQLARARRIGICEPVDVGALRTE
jgi:hypothetical protein